MTSEAPEPRERQLEVARTIALDLLTARQRSIKELRDAMAKRNVPADVADEVLERFGEVGLVDDSAFAASLVASRSRYSQRGRARIRQELQAKVNAGEELTWDDLNSATWSVLSPTSASGYIYPCLWLQDHYGKGISDLEHVVQSDSHTTSVARLAAGQVDVMVSFGHIRIKNAPIWESDFDGTAPMVEQTGVIGVTEGIYNDMIAYSKNSDTMADENFRKALGESFIEIADTDEGREIISVFSQVGYTWGQDSDYDGERAAQELLKSLEG